MLKDISFSIKYLVLLRFGLLFVIFSMHSNLASAQTVGGNAQCNCDKMIVQQTDCKKEKELVFESGENITDNLEAAILENCRVIIKNTNSISSNVGQAGNITLYVSPLVFSNIQNKEIILEQGVTLQGVTGGYSDCSQSVFTFEGAKVQNIIIRGEYDICQDADKPTITAAKPAFSDDVTQGYLVASDGDGEPYLDKFGNPNFVFSDGDPNPYYDNDGKPNLIGNSNKLKVEVPCDYNDYICNRDIVVWCPFSFEGRHLISIQGSDNFTIDNIRMIRSAGGDAVHITDDRDFNPARVVQITNVDFNQNARTGVVFANTKCSTIDFCRFKKNGKYFPTELVEPRGAIAFHQNSNIGSITAYNGKIAQWTQRVNKVNNSTFTNNVGHEFSFDLPLALNHCSNKANIVATDNCVKETSDVLGFKTLSHDIDGLIRFTNFTVDDFSSSMIFVGDDGNNSSLDHRFLNVSINTNSSPPNVYQINNQSFCQNLFVADWCQENINDQLCGQTFNCNFNQNYTCLEEPLCCEFNSFIEPVLGSNCGCDYLFLVDESVSVDSEEWVDMECTIYNTMSDLNNLCEDMRFALVQWSGLYQQFIYSDFVEDPFHFTRKYSGLTSVNKALEFVNDSIDLGALRPMTRYPISDSTKCLKTIIMTDAPCAMFNFSARNEAMELHNESYSTIDIVDYTDNNEYPNCSNNGPIHTVMDGDIYEAQFNCELSGLNSIDFVDSEIFYQITLQYDECTDPIVNWTVTNGGQIVQSNADSTIIVVSTEGIYAAKVLCESGCANVINEVFDVGQLNIQKENAAETRSDKVFKSRNVFIDGKWYTPHERELLQLRELSIEEINPVALFPNPSRGKITFENPYKKKGGIYEIINVQGRIISNGSFSKNQNTVDVTFYNESEGLHILKLTRNEDGFISHTRFVYYK